MKGQTQALKEAVAVLISPVWDAWSFAVAGLIHGGGNVTTSLKFTCWASPFEQNTVLIWRGLPFDATHGAAKVCRTTSLEGYEQDYGYATISRNLYGMSLSFPQ